jgi:hypothetical protein
MSTSISAKCDGTVAHQLTPMLSDRWRFSWQHVMVCATFGLLFMLLGHLPRTASRMWVDLSEGRQIVQSVAISGVDASLPLAEGMPVVVSSWLSHVISANIAQWSGPAAVTHLYSSVVWLYLVLLACMFFVQSPRWPLALLATLAVLLLDAPLRSAAGPETWGAVCFAVLLVILTHYHAPGFTPRRIDDGCERAARTSWRSWLAVGLLFVLWANLHVSFLAGLAIMAVLVIGRAYLVAVKTRSFRRVISDRPLRKWLLLTELAALAALVNPFGIGLYYEALRILTHEKLHEAWVWDAVTLRSWTGVLLLATAATLIVALRFSKRRVHPVHVILLVVAAAGMLLTGYAVRWFAPIVTFVIVRHLYDAVPQVSEKTWARRLKIQLKRLKRAFAEAAIQAGLPTNMVNSSKKSPFAFILTLLCGVIVWTCFVYSPTGHVFLGGGKKVAQPDEEMPQAAGDYLRRRPSEGIVCAPAAWSDWLVWHAGSDTQVLVNSNVHRLPRSVWKDHEFVLTGGPSWEKPLDNYNVTTLLLNKEVHTTLADAARESAAWKVVFEDETALVAQRVSGVKP